MIRMPIFRSVSIAMDKFIRDTVETFGHPTRAGKRVHQFYHRYLLLVVFDGAFGKSHVSVRV